jgi:hypothetical protein
MEKVHDKCSTLLIGFSTVLTTILPICSSIVINAVVKNRKTGKTVMTLTWYSHFQRNGGLNQILRRQTSCFHYSSKVPAVTITAFITILEQIGKIVVNTAEFGNFVITLIHNCI